jgi:tetratricopeptide (TPR) repeat protein
VGEPGEAVKLLEPARKKFPDNYGVHANLGTAYHLLGRHEEAERAIARDLEINPDAHFGLEKYHLALLQYLIRDQDYQRRHVYVDEYTGEFFRRRGENLRDLKYHAAGVLGNDQKTKTREEIAAAKESISSEWRAHLVSEKLLNDSIEWEGDAPPAYRSKWDLSADTNLVRGVMYMAELNPDEPAAMVMAGAIATGERSYNLAVAAYQRAIDLGSPQAELLQWHIAALHEHIRQSLSRRGAVSAIAWLAGMVLVGVPVCGIVLWRVASETQQATGCVERAGSYDP